MRDRTARAALVAAAVVVATLVACSDDASAPDDAASDTAGDIGADADDTGGRGLHEPDDDLAASIAAQAGAAGEGCDPLDPRHCLLPFPSDHLTVEDDASSTGRRVALPPGGMPANADAVAVDPAEWNRNDGFSPATALLTVVEGLDADASALPSWTDLGASLDEDATVVLVDLGSGERVPLWAEADARPDDDTDRALVIRPAVTLDEGVRYAVALRDLVGVDGEPLEPSPLFRAYRDGIDTGDADLESRRDHLDGVLDALEDAGVERAGLLLAWDFTVASERNLSERMLHIRDEALSELGDGAPAFSIDDVQRDAQELVAIEVHGTFDAPSFLEGDGAPGSRFAYDADADDPDRLPARDGTQPAVFSCQVPASALDAGEPAHLALYGHGLLGSQREIRAGNVRAMAEEHRIVFCATKWAGMSEDDVGNAVATLQELSNFPTMADRLQQGVLNQIVLGRLMLADDGLFADPALAEVDVDRSRLVYDGNSQGGIMGGMLAAVSPDVERSVLGVPGMNYSLLLHRSVDWDTYEAILEPAYPDVLERTLAVSLIQMLWDRGEAAGYVHHLGGNDPYPGSAGGPVLLHVALGDHQVTELSPMIQARTIGAAIHRPVTADGRSSEREPGWGIDTLEYPHDGSAIVIWDSGAELIPVGPVAPRAGEDPHEDPRADPEVRRQKAAFLLDGQVVDVCGDDACQAAPVR